MTIKELKELYGLTPWSTGGGFYALGADLNTLQDHILITGDDCRLPETDSEEFTVGIYNAGGEQITYFVTDNLDRLTEIVQAAFMLWGNA